MFSFFKKKSSIKLPYTCLDGFVMTNDKFKTAHLIIEEVLPPFIDENINKHNNKFNWAIADRVKKEKSQMHPQILFALMERHIFFAKNNMEDRCNLSSAIRSVFNAKLSLPIVDLPVFFFILNQGLNAGLFQYFNIEDLIYGVSQSLDKQTLDDQLTKQLSETSDIYNKLLADNSNSHKFTYIAKSNNLIKVLLGLYDYKAELKERFEPEIKLGYNELAYTGEDQYPVFKEDPFFKSQSVIDEIYRDICSKHDENNILSSRWWELERSDIIKEQFAKKDQAAGLFMALISRIFWSDISENDFSVHYDLLAKLIRKQLALTEAEFIIVLRGYLNKNLNSYRFHILLFLKSVDAWFKKGNHSSKIIDLLKSIETEKREANNADSIKIAEKIRTIISTTDEESEFVRFQFVESDDFGTMMNEFLNGLKDEKLNAWNELIQRASGSNGSKPSVKFIKDSRELIKNVGDKTFKAKVNEWFSFLSQLKTQELVTYNQNGIEHSYRTYVYISDYNRNPIKGLVWMCSHFHDGNTLNNLAILASRTFEKIPGVGPAAASIGNACIYTLAHSKGLEGVSHLSRLKLKIRQNNTQKLIQKYIEEASKKLGISSHEIEDLAIPDFDLVNGEKLAEFNDYSFKIKIEGIGKVSSTWIKPDGQPQKSVPAFVNQTANLKARLKKLKAEISLIKKSLTAQRDRLDRSYLFDRKWDNEHFSKHYLNHGLMSFITSKLIWIIENKNEIFQANYINDHWEDVDGKPIKIELETAEFRLWDPANVDTEDVLAWRDRLYSLQIQQPLKQAYREIYLLTDAELNTVVYSNRMAAHILKQHQFNALSALRGWKYSLMGAYDDGIDNTIASKFIPEHNLQAEYWINELNAEDEFNDTGIWNYIATDQVRFSRDENPLNLVDIPKIVFSEIMRDVDLFVGVASVGNDPAWTDNGGLRQYHDYWTSYSFGDLTELAKTRKVVLERLLPRLKIRDVASLDGKFVIVKGKIRTYKIHIGSTNILMEPNDQYLCIVPARGKSVEASNIFLPFEGDRGLSLILSKAFLLADDDKIKDTTIISQISR